MTCRVRYLLVVLAFCVGCAKVQPVKLAAPVPAYLPDLTLTPGKVSPDWTIQKTEQAGGTQEYRLVTSKMRQQVWVKYGYDKTIGPYKNFSSKYEIDHLIPNCIGGASEVDNLWPQTYSGPWNAHIKDRLEVHVRAEVIAGRMTLEKAQSLFTPDWTASYKAEGLPIPTALDEAGLDIPDDDERSLPDHTR